MILLSATLSARNPKKKEATGFIWTAVPVLATLTGSEESVKPNNWILRMTPISCKNSTHSNTMFEV